MRPVGFFILTGWRNCPRRALMKSANRPGCIGFITRPGYQLELYHKQVSFPGLFLQAGFLNQTFSSTL